MTRRTKIVATLGPATDDPQILKEIIGAGMDVARINFSHGEEEDHRARIEALRKASAECGREVGLMGDLQGPKIRVRRFKNSKATLVDGAKFFLDSTLGLNDGNDEGVGVAYSKLHEDVKSGDVLLLNDGQIKLSVDSIEGTRLHTTVILGGILSDHKGVNRQGGGLSAGALTDTDREYIKFAAEMAMDFLAVSFVRNADDVYEARELFKAAGGDGLIVAKIERAEAVDSIESIIEAADVIMVAHRLDDGHRIFADSRLGRQHDSISAIHYCVCNVRHLGSRRNRIFDHRLHHLSRRNRNFVISAC